jgi:hypothetical protein
MDDDSNGTDHPIETHVFYKQNIVHSTSYNHAKDQLDMHINQLHNENYDPENPTRYIFFMQVSPHTPQ